VDWTTTQFIVNLVQLPIDRQDVEMGRRQIAEWIDQPFDAEVGIMPGGVTVAEFERAGIEGLLAFLFFSPMLGHLWFLSFLCWLLLGFAVVVPVLTWLKVPSLPYWLTVSVWRYAWLIPLTAIFQFWMVEPGNQFGPATSTGLLPMPSVLCYYAVFFGYGVCYFDAKVHQVAVGRWYWLKLISAVVVLLPLGLALNSESTLSYRILFALVQVAYAWLVSFAMMGLFHRWFSGENFWMRYLSDSSYWLYLIHIPLIFYVQFFASQWQSSVWLKFALVCVATSAILLISYQLFVRYTLIGTLLNGKRYRLSNRLDSGTTRDGKVFHR